MSAIHNLTAIELSRAYARGELSPVDATESALARMEAFEPRINAMFVIARDQARAAAKASETRWRQHAPLSALDGVPITIKENIYTKGDPAPIGTKANDGQPAPDADAPPSARVREAGCVILGKTTMPDYGMLSSGLSSMHGITRNPWRLDRNTSGSSSGAGAAAVAGYGPLHLGTDIGGSVRLPATHCGIFALKPTLGRVPVNPPFIGRVIGPMTRTVADSALLMIALSRPDARDFTSIAYQPTDYLAALSGNLDLWAKGLRIAFIPDMKCGLPVHPDVRAAATTAAHALERAGAKVEEISSFLTADMLDGMCRFFEARSHNDVAQLPPERRAKILPFILEWCNHRAKDFSGRDVMASVNAVFAIREAAVRATTPYDFVISPTSPIPPYEAELACPGNDPRNALPHIAFTVPYNMSEQPAASINWTYTNDGLPVGVQVIGRRFDDAGVLKLAQVLEGLRPAQRAWPE
jgi:aspartyl-tRNA(Asn)/glutamyl-tRNA(Gln) amidotransferase subunit A